MTDSTAAVAVQQRATRMRALLVGGIAPLVVGLVYVGLVTSWLPELPDPVAVHWTGAGPDGFGPAVPYAYLPILLIVLFAAFAVGFSWRTAPEGLPLAGQKLLQVASLWLAVFLCVIIGGSLHQQRGLADASEAGGVEGWLLLGLAVSLVIAVAAWFVLPPAGAPKPGETAKGIPASATERLSWSRTVSIGTGARITLAVVLAIGVAAVALVITTNGNNGWVGVGILVLVALFTAAMWSWRVTCDRRGLTVRSLLGWPRVRIPLDEIATVRVTTVDPTGEFGGWGWRWAAGGRSGLIMRAGEAIEVKRENGRSLVVTVDDATTAAGVLETFRN